MHTKLLAFFSAILPAAFFNTNQGRTLWICATPQNDALDETEFAALAWVQIKGVGNHGETGNSTNILTYDTWDDDVVQKGKGLTDGGSPEIELDRRPTDPGQIALKAAAATNLNYAFKIVGNDKPDNDPDSKPTIKYNRGLVVGPRTPNGRNEDFDLEVYTLGLNQRQIVVNPVSGL